MKWIEVSDRENIRNMIEREKSFVAIWKGCLCIAEFDEEKDCFYVGFMPDQMDGFVKVSPKSDKFYRFLCTSMPRRLVENGNYI